MAYADAPVPGQRAVKLIGRDAECAAIASTLDRAMVGTSAALLLRGDAGVGKSALLEWATQLAHLRGFQVRRLTGSPIEQDLPLGALPAILAPELRAAPDGSTLPGPLARAIGGSPDGPLTTVTSVATALLQLLSTAGDRQPVLVVVDDAHWLDPSTAAVVALVGRQILADRIALLVAMRPTYGGSGPDRRRRAGDRTSDGTADVWRDVPMLDVHVWSPADTGVALRWGGCPEPLVDELITRTGGLPLAANEALRLLAAGETDVRRLAVGVPDEYQRQITTLAASTKRAVLAASVCDDLRVLRKLGASILDELANAEELGIVALKDGKATFRHPLLRAAALNDAGPADDRSMRRSIAEAYLSIGDVDKGAIHLSAAADGLDEPASEALHALAVRAVGRGALVEAGRAWKRSAALTEDDSQRSPRLVSAAEALFDSGLTEEAVGVIDEAVAVAVDPLSRSDAQSYRLRMAGWIRSPRDIVTELVELADTIEDDDPLRTARLLGSAAGMGYLAGDLRAARRHAERAEELANASGDLVEVIAASSSIAWNAFLLGDCDEAFARLTPLEPFVFDAVRARSWAGIHGGDLLSLVWIFSERWQEAESLLQQLLAATSSMGARLSSTSESFTLAQLQWRQGRFEEAWMRSQACVNVPDLPPISRALIQCMSSRIAASMGLVDETRGLVNAALPLVETEHVPFAIASAELALGHLALSLGINDGAIAHLEKVLTITERMGLIEPGVLLWQGDYLEALIRTGRVEDAARHLRSLADVTDRTGRAWSAGVVDRVRAQLSDDADERTALFARSVRCFRTLGMPFEEARTLAVADEPGAAAAAHGIYRRIGASAWATELDQRSDNVRRSAPPTPATAVALTSSERNVALAVVSGRTDHEISAELQLSVRSVEHYLERVLRKLGVERRDDIAASLFRKPD